MGINFKMLQTKNIFSFICVLLLLSKSHSKPLCTSNLDCDSCQYCGLESEVYSSCFYRNMFCKNDSKIIYSSYLKDEYEIFFYNDPELDNFCGEVEYDLENMNDTIILFNSENKAFPLESSLRCHYLINSINKSADYPYLELNIKNILKSNETKTISGFKADIGAIFTLSDSNIEEVETINDSEIVDKYYIKTLSSTTRLEMFLDFEPKKANPNEVLEIKLNFGQKFNNFTRRNYYRTNYDDDYSTTTSSTSKESSSSDSGTIAGATGGVAAIFIIGVIAYCGCCKTEKRLVEVETTRCALQ